MWQAVLLVVNTVLLVLILGILGLRLRDYFRLKRVVRHIASAMDCDELIDQMLDEERSPSALSVPLAQLTDHMTPSRTGRAQQSRLAAVAAGGQA